MQLSNSGAQIFVPDDTPPGESIGRTTHMAIGAHQDDIPIMAHHGIMDCFGRTDGWFLGVTVTDGAGSPRGELYAEYTDEQMREVRNVEETKAAVVGDYTAALLLDYPSSVAKDPDETILIEELTTIIGAAHPEVVYTHNLADKHDTHVAVALRTIEAIRRLDPEDRPTALYGCEVWRDLDWMADADKVAFDVTDHGNLAAALMGVYDSQVSGGKRYDLATEGRRLAHATFSESHAVDAAQALIYAMDLTPVISDKTLDPAQHVLDHLDRLQTDITARIDRVTLPSKSV
ncbi:MAG: PIG-L family deacetylase [Actinomycetota bacterium]|nr:PIG-L family deacetylase [Actinomycetota bacterium]